MLVKPFLVLGTRAEDEAADNEYAAVLSYAGLGEAQLHRRRLEAEPLGAVDPADWSGIILGGGPFNVSDPAQAKSPVQQRVEAELRELAEKVVAGDSPFFGACYGIGTLGVLRGGVVDRRYGEPVGCVSIALTDAGRADPVFGVLPDTFDAFLGHKEAVARLPEGAVLLASSAACPVQAFRLGEHVYATQFHPELDRDGLCTRVDVYQHYGYFDPSEVARLKAMAHASSVTEPEKLLAAFVDRYARR
ncbi:MAG: glutamine amidotransferase [Nocardioides sp.]